MHLSTTFSLAVAGLASLAAAHNIQLKAHTRDCFHEMLHRDDRMTVTFQVGDREFGGSGNLGIDFYVMPPRFPNTHIHTPNEPQLTKAHRSITRKTDSRSRSGM